MVANTVEAIRKTGRWVTIFEGKLTGTGKTYFHPDPLKRVNVFLKKNGSTAVPNGTNSDIDPIDNAPYVAIDENGASTDDFFGGDSTGFTGIEIDVSVYAADLDLIIKQYVVG